MKKKKIHLQFSISRTVIYRPKYLTSRISAQNGFFTVHKIFQDSNTIISVDNHRTFKNYLTKIKIPIKYFPSIRNTLNIMGINNFTTFPDLDGLSHHLQWRYFKLSDEKI